MCGADKLKAKIVVGSSELVDSLTTLLPAKYTPVLLESQSTPTVLIPYKYFVSVLCGSQLSFNVLLGISDL